MIGRARLVVAAMGLPLLLAACSGKYEKEYDFRPHIASWAGKNCGSKKEYQCSLVDGFADEGWDGEDYVYGILYVDKDGKKRVVYVKVEARKPHEVSVVGDEPLKEK